MITIAEAHYENAFRIKLKFNPGEEGIADLSDIIERYSIAAPLKYLIEFQRFYLDEWPSLAWSCGFDLSPEML
jgi:hypothetical protein